MPETQRTPQNRAEGLCGGAGKHCYVKYEWLAALSEPASRRLFENGREKAAEY